MACLSDIPKDVVCIVFCYLGGSFLSATLVCKKWNELILSKVLPPSQYGGLVHACYHGHVEYYRKWYNPKLFNPDTTQVYHKVSHFDHYGRVQQDELTKLINGQKKALGYNLVEFAVFKEQIELVKVLLEDERVQKNVGWSFRIACVKGNVEMVKLLWKFASPCSKRNYCLVHAAEGGDTKIVRMLLDDPRTFPSCRKNMPLARAMEFGRTEVAKMILNHPRTLNIGSFDRWNFRIADEYVDDALLDKISDKDILSSWFQECCLSGAANTVKLLLERNVMYDATMIKWCEIPNPEIARILAERLEVSDTLMTELAVKERGDLLIEMMKAKDFSKYFDDMYTKGDAKIVLHLLQNGLVKDIEMCKNVVKYRFVYDKEIRSYFGNVDKSPLEMQIEDFKELLEKNDPSYFKDHLFYESLKAIESSEEHAILIFEMIKKCAYFGFLPLEILRMFFYDPCTCQEKR